LTGGFGGGGGQGGGMNMDDILVSLEIFSVAPLAVAAVVIGGGGGGQRRTKGNLRIKVKLILRKLQS
jgi:molecular chaperone DnaJ